MPDPDEPSRSRLGVSAAWGVWTLVNLVCVWQCVRFATSIMVALETDASVVGTFDDPGSSCPDRIEYVVDGVTYEVGVDGRGWCSRENGDVTSPQRVFYDSDDPATAVFADPGGPTASIVVAAVALTLLAGLTVWLWRRWWRWSRVRLRAHDPRVTRSDDP